MELRIRDSNKFIDVQFGLWLIPRIKTKLISSIRKYKLNTWDTYLTEDASIKRLYKKDYKAEDVITFAADNLSCTGVDGEISIQFNFNKLVPGFDRLRLTTIVKTINYGTLDIKSCPIFTDTFNYFAKNIDTYVGIYYRL